MRGKSNDPAYDYSRVGYARRHAIQVLDGYACSTAEIIAMFGCSQATFHRYDLDVRLSRRPARPARRYEMSPPDAREIVVIALIRAGYAVTEIAKAIGVSPATVYRERALFEARLGDTSPAERRHIHRTLKRNIIDNRPFHQRRIDAKRRSKRWRRGSRSKFSS
jgi:transposase-like protein